MCVRDIIRRKISEILTDLLHVNDNRVCNGTCLLPEPVML